MILRDYARYGRGSDMLLRAIQSGKVSHAYILEGDHNIDKVGFAKAFARALLCRESQGQGCDHCVVCRKIMNDNHEDLYHLEPEGSSSKGNLSIKDQAVDELQAKLKMRPTGGDRNIAIISGADHMTVRAQNRFLKTLEEPTPGTVIMLLSENADNLLQTIRSRCVTVRLLDFDTLGNSEADQLAAQVLSMVKEGAFFYDIKEVLDKKIKDRLGAYEFLDGMESQMGQMMRSGGGAFSRSALSRAIALTEKARIQIRRNVSYKYVIRDLILKLEENE